VYWNHPPQLPYRHVGYSEQALCYILVVWQPIIIIIPVCVGLRIWVYSGGYPILSYSMETVYMYLHPNGY
jgi:hypothetical protein